MCDEGASKMFFLYLPSQKAFHGLASHFEFMLTDALP